MWCSAPDAVIEQTMNMSRGSDEGCVLFVKLRQFHPDDRERVAIDTRTAEWFPGSPGASPSCRCMVSAASGSHWSVGRRTPASFRMRIREGRRSLCSTARWRTRKARTLQPGGLPAVREDRPPTGGCIGMRPCRALEQRFGKGHGVQKITPACGSTARRRTALACQTAPGRPAPAEVRESSRSRQPCACRTTERR